MDDKTIGCWVCGKKHLREKTNEYKYFNGTLVCSHHNGATEWYEGALKLADVKLKIVEEKMIIEDVAEMKERRPSMCTLEQLNRDGLD